MGIKPKRSKTWDMKWHWLIDKKVLEQLRVYWDIRTNNDADYFTKASSSNSPLSNATLVYTYLEFSEEIFSDHKIIRGCVEPSLEYSVPCQLPEEHTIRTTIYEQEIPYGQMVKPP